MFKKRAAPNKSVNLSEQITKIQFKQVQVKAQPTLSHIADTSGERIQSACTNSLFQQQQPKITQPEIQSSYLQTLLQENLLRQTPAKFKKRDGNGNGNDNFNETKQTNSNPHKQQHQSNLIIIEQQSSQQQSVPPPPSKIIIVEQDENNLEVIEDVMGDNGVIDSEQEDFANEIIRKALTKDNYNKVRKDKKKSTPTPTTTTTTDSKQKTILKKIDMASVLNNILKQQSLKQRNLQSINQSLTRYKTELTHRQAQLHDSRTKLQTTKEKFEQIKSVLQFIYSRGDEVKQFNVNAILDQMYS